MTSSPMRPAICTLTAMIVLLAVGIGCDTSVPIFENPSDHPLYYSIYGQIAVPDGGTIRVERLRDSIVTGTPAAAPEVVTFERMGSGEVDTLSVHSREVGRLSVHNYRTPSSLTAGAEYRVAVTGPNGNRSSAVFALPERQPEVEVLDTLRYCKYDGGACGEGFAFRFAQPIHVRIDSVDRLGRVALRYHTRFGRSRPYRWTNTFQRIDDDAYTLQIKPNEDLVDVSGYNGLSGRGRCSFAPPPPAVTTTATVKVAAVGPSWPGPAFNLGGLREAAFPRTDSNVKQGVGLVLGTHAAEASVPVVVPEPGSLQACPSDAPT